MPSYVPEWDAHRLLVCSNACAQRSAFARGCIAQVTTARANEHRESQRHDTLHLNVHPALCHAPPLCHKLFCMIAQAL